MDKEVGAKGVGTLVGAKGATATKLNTYFQTFKTDRLKVTAYVGDCKTMLAFNFPDASYAKNLAGFTIQARPPGGEPYFLHNTLQFKDPAAHAQVAGEAAHSSVNAPFHRFRYVHVPGSVHQGTHPAFGNYTYTVTPRYFDDNQSLKPLDPGLSVQVTVYVGPFAKKNLKVGFTRGYTQSQAFDHHFGRNALIRPKGKELLFDTAQISGKDEQGTSYTFAEEYEWLGFSARDRIFEFLNEVRNDPAQYLSVFAYDLNEPDICEVLLELAKQGRVRIILDNAALHHSASSPEPEDEFEAEFCKVAKDPADILRGHFKRYAHDKVFISFTKDRALKVLTGSTNFSVTGLYVNSNHVLVFEDEAVALEYGQLFQTVWDAGVKATKYLASPFESLVYSVPETNLPKVSVTFAPHEETTVDTILGGIVKRIEAEDGKHDPEGSVLFAVMEIDNGTSPVYKALQETHAHQDVFSMGISDSNAGISLYRPGDKEGILVTGKPGSSILPPPFDQVRTIGAGHQIHHKFVVCGFNGDDPTVYCGSSNLAQGGEASNGDNLLEIHDADVAAAFAIEALSLVDHFQFLNRLATPEESRSTKPMPASKKEAAQNAAWFLSTTDSWTKPYFDPSDLHYADRQLFCP
ncbi:MAG TPA: phospholipase D-like domain-containing protein [Gallionella sp.]|nr:phospholipase D-like domain-containing protein [Gallionella sp.]